MKSQGVLDFRLVADIGKSDNIEKLLQDILTTVECLKDNGTSVSYSDELYDQLVFDDAFVNWLYNLNEQPELSTIKRELSIKINKATRITLSDYQAFLERVERQDCPEKLLLSIQYDTSQPLYVGTPTRYWAAKQWYVAKYVKQSDFFAEVIGSFPNLYFHPHVDSSLNTLNADFATERPYIVQHLQALDSFREQFSELRENGVEFRKVCVSFQEYSGIECSPQSDRRSAQKLDYAFPIGETKRETTLRCELHTKLKWDGMDTRNQDRIYFHPGAPEIEDGKVLIAHIGTHQ